jgi:hypothetical protein
LRYRMHRGKNLQRWNLRLPNGNNVMWHSVPERERHRHSQLRSMRHDLRRWPSLFKRNLQRLLNSRLSIL